MVKCSEKTLTKATLKPDGKGKLDLIFKFQDIFTLLIWLMIFESLSAVGYVIWKKREKEKKPFTALCPSAIASSHLSTPAEIRQWSASVAYFFPFRFNSPTYRDRCLQGQLLCPLRNASHWTSLP